MKRETWYETLLAIFSKIAVILVETRVINVSKINFLPHLRLQILQELLVVYMCFKVLMNFTKWHFCELLQHFKMLETKFYKEDFNVLEIILWRTSNCHKIHKLTHFSDANSIIRVLMNHEVIHPIFTVLWLLLLWNKFNPLF